jgi:cytochrome c peroxidase
MTKRLATGTLVLALAVASSAGCEKKKEEEPAPKPRATTAPAATAAAVEIDPSILKTFGPLPDAYPSADNPITEEKVALGRMLYYEPRLSLSHEISCNTCHDLAQFGVDPRGQKTSEGHNKKLGRRNSPTVYMAAGHFAQFWDAREPTVEAQAVRPILNPDEMAMPTEKAVITELKLKTIPGYQDAFKKAFPDEKDPITFANIGKAIGAFERKLVTPSRWDKYVQGDKTAVTDAEKAGFKKYMEVGCITCHSGPLFGGAMLQKLGSVVPWPNQEDLGRYEVTKKEEDKMMFKAPSLRNIEKTAPYYHDGSVATLEEAVKTMAKHQLGRDLSDADVTSIVTFLKTLTGEIPKDYIAKPELPKSGATTPGPSQ